MSNSRAVTATPFDRQVMATKPDPLVEMFRHKITIKIKTNVSSQVRETLQCKIFNMNIQ